MLLSDILMKKATEEDNLELYKLASEIQYTEIDENILEKDAGLWSGVGSTLLAAGKGLVENKTLRNAAIGAGVGAIAGAYNAKPGSKISGALKGAALGGAVGGVATAGANVYKGMGAGQTFGAALQSEGSAINTSLQKGKGLIHGAYQTFKQNKLPSITSPTQMGTDVAPV